MRKINDRILDSDTINLSYDEFILPKSTENEITTQLIIRMNLLQRINRERFLWWQTGKISNMIHYQQN